jgi:hypothetical protein
MPTPARRVRLAADIAEAPETIAALRAEIGKLNPKATRTPAQRRDALLMRALILCLRLLLCQFGTPTDATLDDTGAS